MATINENRGHESEREPGGTCGRASGEEREGTNDVIQL